MKSILSMEAATNWNLYMWSHQFDVDRKSQIECYGMCRCLNGRILASSSFINLLSTQSIFHENKINWNLLFKKSCICFSQSPLLSRWRLNLTWLMTIELEIIVVEGAPLDLVLIKNKTGKGPKPTIKARSIVEFECLALE